MGAGAERPATDRVQLARLAARAVADHGGVTAAAGPGRRWVTADGDGVIDGVVALAGAERVDLELHVAASWPPPPLSVLAADLRLRVRLLAETAFLAHRLGAVRVSIHDVVEPVEQDA